MTEPALQIDPAFAKALELYDVPSPSPTFADRIVAAASGAKPDLPSSHPSRRDRRGPWTRRAVAGGLALVLGTTAVAATLLERAGIRLPEVVAMLSPASRVAPPSLVVKHHVRVAKRVAAPAVQSEVVTDDVTAMPIPERLELPPRITVIRERLASLPPAERRVVVRRAIRRAVVARAIERRLAVGGAVGPSPLDLGRADPPRLLERPAVRAALVERIGEARAARIAARERLERPDAPPLAPAEAPTLAVPAPITPTDADSAAGAPPPQARLERLHRLAELRRMRALRQELRRQRRR